MATTRDQTRVRVALSTGAGRVSVKDTGIGMRVPAAGGVDQHQEGADHLGQISG